MNVQAGIRAYRWENFPKINKRTCTFIPYSRVEIEQVVPPGGKMTDQKFMLNVCAKKLPKLMNFGANEACPTGI